MEERWGRVNKGTETRVLSKLRTIASSIKTFICSDRPAIVESLLRRMKERTDETRLLSILHLLPRIALQNSIVTGIQPTDKSFRYEEIAPAARSRSASLLYVCFFLCVCVCVYVLALTASTGSIVFRRFPIGNVGRTAGFDALLSHGR